MSIFNILQICSSQTGVYSLVEYSVTYNDDFFCLCTLLRYFLENLQAPRCVRYLGHRIAVSVPRKWCPWLECQSNVCRIMRNHPHRRQVWIVGRRHVISIKCNHIRMQQVCSNSNLWYYLFLNFCAQLPFICWCITIYRAPQIHQCWKFVLKSCMELHALWNLDTCRVSDNSFFFLCLW